MRCDEEYRPTPLARPPVHKNCKCTQKCLVTRMPPSKSKKADEDEGSLADDQTDHIQRNYSYDQLSDTSIPQSYRLSSSSQSTPVKELHNNSTDLLSGEFQTQSRTTPEKLVFEASLSKTKSKDKYNQKDNVISIIPLAIIGVILAMFVYGVYWYINKSTIAESFILQNEFIKLDEKYGQTDEFWRRIESSLLITNSTLDVSVFVLVYGQTYATRKVNSLAKKIAGVAGKFLDENLSTDNPLELNPSDVEDEDFLPKYRELLRESRAMVVYNVNRVSAEFAKPLHYFCDEYNPLVRKSAILFTLDVNECQGDSGEINTSPEQLVLKRKAEDCLAEAWKKLPSEYLQPLLARIVNVILLVDTAKL